MPDLSIIIISYNTREITKKCLETVCTSLSAANFTSEIIILDNNSTDNSVEMLKFFLKKQNQILKFKLIQSDINLGFAKGNNEAVKHSSGETLLFLNSDIEVLDDAIPKLFQYFKSPENRFQFVGGKLFDKNGTTPQASCGPFFSLPVIFAFLFLRGDYWGFTRWSPNHIREVDWVSGACFIGKKSDYESLEGFDENIFMYMDEIDLFFRAKKRGIRLGFYPEARFIHLGSASSNERTEPILQVYKGYLYFYKKHFSPLKLAVLKSMLQLKAVISLCIGFITNNKYLKKTYEQAWKNCKTN